MLVITIIYMILYAIITFIPNLAMTVRRSMTLIVRCLFLFISCIRCDIFYCPIDLEY